jgi:chromosome segregation ATPase
MKTKIGLVVLIVLCVGLAIGLVVLQNQAADRQAKDASTIGDLSHQLTVANTNLLDLQQVNLSLNNTLAGNKVLLADLSNNLATVYETVTNVRSSLAAAVQADQAAQAQIAGQSNRITDLQTQNKLLDDRATALAEQAVALTNRINALNQEINDTLVKLARSETNNVLLDQQLEQLVEMKAELEHKFDTLAAVRDQVKKLREEVVAARRLQWMKEGTDVQIKGAQKLLQLRDAPFLSVLPPGTNYSLDVEVGSDGSVRAIPPPVHTATNPPAH